MKFSNLSPTTQFIIRLFDEIAYGHLVNIDVINGEPCITKDSRKRPNINLDKETRKNVTPGSEDYELNVHQVRFIQALQQHRNGRILDIGIHDGLPATLVFDEEVITD